eukprot:scaffold9250_cov105-Isochrysis_galbana.AAC.12
MGAAITYLLLDLEGVDTEPDILDDGKKGPWTIFATADCAEQFKAKYGEQIALTSSRKSRSSSRSPTGRSKPKKAGLPTNSPMLGPSRAL